MNVRGVLGQVFLGLFALGLVACGATPDITLESVEATRRPDNLVGVEIAVRNTGTSDSDDSWCVTATWTTADKDEGGRTKTEQKVLEEKQSCVQEGLQLDEVGRTHIISTQIIPPAHQVVVQVTKGFGLGNPDDKEHRTVVPLP